MVCLNRFLLKGDRHFFYLLEIGQERATIGFDDDVKITPFNIDEELEDGHYDETGCFHWKKKDVCLFFILMLQSIFSIQCF
jgi:hypothetical protein